MEGLLTHVATADCFIMPPHPALDCGIVTAWWHYQVKGTDETRRGPPSRAASDPDAGGRRSAPALE